MMTIGNEKENPREFRSVQTTKNSRPLGARFQRRM